MEPFFFHVSATLSKLKICPQFAGEEGNLIIAWATLSYYTNEN